MRTRRTFLIAWLMAFAPLGLGVHAQDEAASELPVGIMPARYDYSVLNTVGIQAGGRKKPYYTFAKESLNSLSGRETYEDDTYGEFGPMAAVTSMWLNPEPWKEEPLILVSHTPLKEALNLNPKQKRFSFAELSRTTRLREMVGEVVALRNDPDAPALSQFEKEVETVAMRLLLFEEIASGNAIKLVPGVASPDSPWHPPSAAPSLYPGPIGQAVAETVGRLRAQFLAADTGGFRKEAEALAKALSKLNPEYYPGQEKLQIEYFYDTFHPFRWAWIAYLAAAIVLALTSIAARRTGYVAGWILALTGLALQVFGFVLRIVIAGRAPVTNMYETVIWVAFGTVLFALVLEAIYRCRYFLLGACPAAVLSLILADTQTTVLDSSINPLVPVLRDNFWLSTHVTTITLSYAAFLLALGVAHIVMGKVILGRNPSTALYMYLYRAIQIGVLLLAVGTVLGAVWANYSWGRFWDWDPKETWALITLLCYLAILHGRLVGWWGGFGLAVGSVIGFLCVLMAWYGVNFVLGQGLHSYGFGTGGKGYVAAVCVVELLFTGLALWRRSTLTSREKTPTRNDASGEAAPALDL